MMLVFLSILGYAASDSYFCDLLCDGKYNTACYREPCLPNKYCGEHYTMLPMTDEDRQWVLDEHNKYRNSLAKGEDSRGGNGKSSNMRALSYSKEMEFVAQCWANNCKVDGPHDECRTTSQFTWYVGQNVFSLKTTGDAADFASKGVISQAVTMWYEEIKDTTAGVIDKFHNINGKMIGHFTQVAWAKTSQIGCGRTQYGKGKVLEMQIVCNYGEGGNIMSWPVYKRGDPCTACGKDQCNGKYSGLCGEIRPLEADNWTPPFSNQKSTGGISGLISPYFTELAGFRITNSGWDTLLVVVVTFVAK